MESAGQSAELGRFVEAGELRRAAKWLVVHHAEDVVAMCRSMVRQREAAEDIAQEVFSSAFASLGSFRHEASPRTWLLAIARNRCIDHLRRARRDPWGGAAPDDAEPDDFADDAPLPVDVVVARADLDAALGVLPEAERALVVLRFRQGLEYSELAQAFGLREGTVRMRLSRALARMRAVLDPTERARALDEMAAPSDTRGRAVPAAPPAAAPAAASRSTGASPAPGAGAAAPSRAHGWWTRLLAAFGVRSTLVTSDDEPQVSPELRRRLDQLASAQPADTTNDT